MKKILFVVVLLILFLTGSALTTKDILNNAVTILLWLLCTALIVFMPGNFNFGYKRLVLLAAILLLMFISSVVNDNNYLMFIKIAVSIIIVFLFFSKVSFASFKESYVSVVVLLAVISLIFYPLYMTVPNLSNVFVFQSGRYSYSTFILYSHCVGSFRNGGMFWEPGAFMVFLNLALLFEVLSKKVSLFKIIVLSAAIITTFSTTGYIALALTIILLLFTKYERKIDKTKKRIVLVISIIAFLILLGFFGEIVFGKGELSTFGKIEQFFERHEYLGVTNGTSASIRFFSIVKPFELFVQKPIFGVGRDYLISETMFYTRGAITSTVSNWFAVYGLAFGIIMTTGTIMFSIGLSTKVFDKIISVLIFAVFLVSQDFSTNAVFYLLVFYGFFGNKILVPKERVCLSKYCV